MSPTQRSLKRLRDAGYLASVVERFVRFPPPGHRVDLFGFVDLIAIRGDEVLAVQATVGASVSARIEKIRNEPNVFKWLSSNMRVIEIHGWAKRGAKGKRKLWTCRVVKVGQLRNGTLCVVEGTDDFPSVPLVAKEVEG